MNRISDFSELQNEYEEDFTDLPEEEDEIPVKRVPVLRQTQHGARQNDHLTNGQTGNGPSVVRKLTGSGLKNGNSTGVRKTTSSGLNRSLRLPQIRPARNDAFNGTSRRPTDQVSERVLSARANRVHELENERNLLRVQVQDQKREVQTLNGMLRRQGKVLGQYEGTDDKLPTLLRQSEEDGRVTREQLRLSRQKYAQLRENYRQLEVYSQTLERERDKLLAIVRDKGLQDGKLLKDERDQLAEQLDDARTKEKEFERRVATLQKAQGRERQFSDNRLKEQTLLLDKVQLENTSLKEQLKSALAYKERSRTHVQSRERKGAGGRSTTGSSHSPVVARQRQSREEDQRLLQNAKPSFLQEFHAVTGSTLQPSSELKNSVKNSVLSHTGTSQADDPRGVPLNAWKSRTSPDLLRDHEERIVFADLPSSSSSLVSASTVRGEERKISQQFPPDRKVAEQTANETKKPDRKISVEKVNLTTTKPVLTETPSVTVPVRQENVLKNDLLEKIRLLDVSRKEATAAITSDDYKKRNDVLDNDSSVLAPQPKSAFVAHGTSLATVHPQPTSGFFHTQVPAKSAEYSAPSHAGDAGRYVKTKPLDSDDEIEEIEFF